MENFQWGKEKKQKHTHLQGIQFIKIITEEILLPRFLFYENDLGAFLNWCEEGQSCDDVCRAFYILENWHRTTKQISCISSILFALQNKFNLIQFLN